MPKVKSIRTLASFDDGDKRVDRGTYTDDIPPILLKKLEEKNPYVKVLAYETEEVKVTKPAASPVIEEKVVEEKKPEKEEKTFFGGKKK
jgi:hypothetical protein